MKKLNWLMMVSLGVIAAVIYFASVVDYAYPGVSASLQVAWQGLDGGAKVQYPLMAVFARMLGGGNLIAPVLGVISVLLLFWMVSYFISESVQNEKTLPFADTLGLVAGTSAAFIFMLTPAVHEAATHLEPRLFDCTWGLAISVLFVLALKHRRGMRLVLAALAGVMFALGVCDSVIFLVISPLWVYAIVAIELKREVKPYAALTVFFLVALVAFVVALSVFDLSFIDHLKTISTEFKAYHNTQGWLFVTIFSTLPFLVSIFSSRTAFVNKPTMTQWLFHVAMSVIVILAVATPLAPSSLMEPMGVLPVATSAFAAITGGYLLSFWWLQRKHPIGAVSGTLLAFVVVFASLWNLFTFDGDRGRFADRVADRILADLGDRKWLVTDGSIDDHLRLAAAQKGREINLISLNRDLDLDYLVRLGDLVRVKGIGGSKNEELSLSLTLGVLPFVQDWFAADPTVDKQVAIFGASDLWYSAGMKPVPEFMFFGSDATRTADWSAWKEFDAILAAPKKWGSFKGFDKVTSPVDKLRLNLRRHLGMVANNRGVYLQDLGKNDEAWKMYELVLNEIDADNVCALFNEIEMSGQKYAPAIAKKRELEQAMKKIIDDKDRRYVIWRLGSYYGYIRNPDMFVRLGLSWARSGRPGDALAQIRRAIDFVPTDKRSVLMNMMAALYASDNDKQKSRRLYEEVLAKDAKDHDALIGMMRLELLEGNSDKALDYLKRAAAVSPADGRTARIEMVMLALIRGDLKAARTAVRKVLDADNKDMQGWSLFAAISMQEWDQTTDKKRREAIVKELNEKIVPQMEKYSTNPYDYYLQITKAFVLMRQGENRRREARDAFAIAAKANPANAATHDMVLGLDISLDDKVNAEYHARDVLRRNRNAPLANYVMGSIAIGKGDYKGAEAFLRKAVNVQKPNALALNDIAEVLRRLHRYAEAERFARKGVELYPDFYIIHETLGVVILENNGNLDESEREIRKSIELGKKGGLKEDDARVWTSLARVLIRKGDKNGARSAIRKVQQNIKQLTDYERREFEEMLKSVR